MKAALGMCTAATIGAVILGPVSLVVSAASVAIGMGVMQIPEEQRNNVVRNHAVTSLERASGLGCDVGNSVSTSCAKYSGTYPAEILGKVIPDESADVPLGSVDVSTDGHRDSTTHYASSIPVVPAAVAPSVMSATSNNVQSMLQDVEARRTTEVRYLNGYVSTLGRERT